MSSSVFPTRYRFHSLVAIDRVKLRQNIQIQVLECDQCTLFRLLIHLKVGTFVQVVKCLQYSSNSLDHRFLDFRCQNMPEGFLPRNYASTFGNFDQERHRLVRKSYTFKFVQCFRFLCE